MRAARTWNWPCFSMAPVRDIAAPLSMRPLEVQAPGVASTPLDVAMALEVERNRIGITSADIATGHSSLHLNGELADLQSPHGTVHYQVNASVADASRAFGIKLLDRGEVQSQGTLTWPGGAAYTVAGDLHAAGVEYRGAYVQLRNSRAEGSVSVNPQRVELTGLRFSTSVGGSGACKGTVWPCATLLAGNIAAAEVRGNDLELRGLAVALLGGQFQGQARLLNLDRFTVNGEISGVDARRAVAVYSAEPLPWNGLVSGQTRVEGRLQRSGELRAQVDLSLTPAPEGAPVHGQLTATYDTRGNRIDVGHSTLTLPSSSAEISGVVGSRLQVHLETRDLNDFLPVLGQSAASLPVKLQNGCGRFRWRRHRHPGPPAVERSHADHQRSLFGPDHRCLPGGRGCHRRQSPPAERIGGSGLTARAVSTGGSAATVEAREQQPHRWQRHDPWRGGDGSCGAGDCQTPSRFGDAERHRPGERHDWRSAGGG